MSPSLRGKRSPHGGVSLPWNGLLLSGLLLLPVGGCSLFPRSEAQTGPPAGAEEAAPVAVETAVAATGTVEDVLAYTGTTRPTQEVSVRSQLDGQIQALPVDVGDAVVAGEMLAQIDDDLPQVALNEARAEMTARQSEVAQAKAEVSDVRTAYNEARARLQQARIDAERLRRLANEGAIPEQEAEQAELDRDVAQQALRSAEEQIRTRQQAVNAAQGRVESQRAVIAQQQERLSYASVRSPLTGVVLTKTLEAGDYAQDGDEILRLGDLNTVEVTVQISELDLSRIRPGQTVQVRLDAFPGESFAGRVSRIAPVADATARLLPVEITMDNPEGRISSGLLARVRFTPPGTAQVVVPTAAVQTADGTLQIFVVNEQAAGATVSARVVQLGRQANDQVEILSGLQSGETYVVSSDRPLSDGQAVRLSILSETRAE